MNIDIESHAFKRHQKNIQTEMEDMLVNMQLTEPNKLTRSVFLPLAHYHNSGFSGIAPEGIYLNFEQNQSLKEPFKIAGTIYIGEAERFSMWQFNQHLAIPQSPEKQALGFFFWNQKNDAEKKQFLKEHLPFNRQKDIHKITRSLHKIFKEGIKKNQQDSHFSMPDKKLTEKVCQDIIFTDLPMISYSIYKAINYIFTQDQAESDWPCALYNMSQYGDFTLQVDIGKKEPEVSTILVIQGTRYWHEAFFENSPKMKLQVAPSETGNETSLIVD